MGALALGVTPSALPLCHSTQLLLCSQLTIGELEKGLDAQSDMPVDRADLLNALGQLTNDGVVDMARGRRTLTVL